MCPSAHLRPCRGFRLPARKVSGIGRAAALQTAAGAASFWEVFLEEGDHVAEHLRRAVAAVFLAQAHLALDSQLVHVLFQGEEVHFRRTFGILREKMGAE